MGIHKFRDTQFTMTPAPGHGEGLSVRLSEALREKGG